MSLKAPSKKKMAAGSPSLLTRSPPAGYVRCFALLDRFGNEGGQNLSVIMDDVQRQPPMNAITVDDFDHACYINKVNTMGQRHTAGKFLQAV